MHIEEQKKIIIQRIKAIDDEQVIGEVYEILNASEHHQHAIPLSADQEWIMNEPMAQYKAGKFISQDELEEKNRPMARNIIWSENAEHQLQDILMYWKDRNRSNVYPLKLRRVFPGTVKVLAA